jgi:putative endonuclease
MDPVKFIGNLSARFKNQRLARRQARLPVRQAGINRIERNESLESTISVNKKVLGKKGEEEALQYLQVKGYEILELNYRWGRGEIDIICKKKNLIIFVEVKTRKSRLFGDPVEAVDKRKQRQIIKIAERYLVQEKLYNKSDCRFDVITLSRDKLNHIKDAFRPER